MTVPDPKDFIRSHCDAITDIEDIYTRDKASTEQLEIYEKWIQCLLESNVKSYDEIKKTMHKLRREYKISPRNSDLLSVITKFKSHANYDILRYLLISTKTRSQSGVVVITVVTSPYPEVDGKVQSFSCQWNCYYCPNEPNQPRSYLHDEPAVIRANANNFDPILQFHDRARALSNKGHNVDKVELIVLGGTWESYPEEYREYFCRDLFYAANIFTGHEPLLRDKLSLSEEQVINETSECKIIGLTLETRPDTINYNSIKLLRYYGCTRVQLGVQHTDNLILKKINRKCTTSQVKEALRLLKDSCYKVDIHLMPNLPGSSPEKDMAMFDNVLYNEDLQADQWKIYPCEVVPWTIIKKWYDEGTYVPYDGNSLKIVLKYVKKKVHPWIRLNRVVRDIPSQYIYNDSVPNLRDDVLAELQAEGTPCKCIRCREVGSSEHRKTHHDLSNFEVVIRNYRASGAEEYYISFENLKNDILAGFVRLRLPENYLFEHMEKSAFIRELHVYGEMLPVGVDDAKRIQHSGIGSQLLTIAEQYAIRKGYTNMVVIAGIGTRNYYRKRGYTCTDELGYLHKKLFDYNRTLLKLGILGLLLSLICFVSII